MKTRILAILCVVAMLATFMVACSDPADSQDSETTPPVSDVTTPVQSGNEGTDTTPGVPVDANGFEIDDLPADLNFEDRDFNIYSWQPTYPEWSDGESGEHIDNSLYERQLNVEERLGIKLVIEQSAGSNHYRREYLQRVSTLVNGGDATYELIAQYSWCSGSGALQGLYADLANTEYINFDKPWWPSDIVESTRMDGKMYFATGDIAPSLIFSTFVTLFNEKLIQDYGLENPYDLVEQNKWTLDKVISMTSNFYNDDDGSGDVSADDLFGFTFWADTHTKAFLYGSGLRVVEVNGDDEYQLSDKYTGQKMQDLIDKMNAWIFDNNGVLFNDNLTEASDLGAFGSGKALMGEYDMYFVAYVAPNSEITYGIVPTPKYDEDQEGYYHFYGNAITTFSIPKTVLDTSAASAVIEALASEGYRTVTPAIFEIALKEKYAPSPKAAEMLDLIHKTIVIDVAPFYTDTMTGYKEMRTALSESKTPWASQYAGVKTMLNKAIANVNKKLADLD